MKKSTLVGGVISAVVGVAIGAVSTITFNKIKSSKEEEIKSVECETKDKTTDENESTEKQED